MDIGQSSLCLPCNKGPDTYNICVCQKSHINVVNVNWFKKDNCYITISTCLFNVQIVFHTCMHGLGKGVVLVNSYIILFYYTFPR